MKQKQPPKPKRHLRKLDGILLLDKAIGVSSNKALQDARFLFLAEKAGHTGSLDPLASGMLPVCFGEATKVSAFLLDSDKRYITTATLGYVSTTGDGEGEKCNPRPIPTFSDAELDALLNAFRGSISQVPPMYSALKKDGQPLYKLARQGVEIEREARQVTIHSLTVLERTATTITLDVTCSKGTYIRSLVEDIGEALGCGAYVSLLHRASVEPFAHFPMYSLTQLQQLAEQGMVALEAVLLPLDAALPQTPRLVLNDEQVGRIQQGQRFHVAEIEHSDLVRLYTKDEKFIGLGQVNSALLSVRRLLSV